MFQVVLLPADLIQKTGIRKRRLTRIKLECFGVVCSEFRTLNLKVA